MLGAVKVSGGVDVAASPVLVLGVEVASVVAVVLAVEDDGADEDWVAAGAAGLPCPESKAFSWSPVTQTGLPSEVLAQSSSAVTW